MTPEKIDRIMALLKDFEELDAFSMMATICMAIDICANASGQDAVSIAKYVSMAVRDINIELGPMDFKVRRVV